MDEKNRRLLTPVLTVLGCAAFLGILIAMAVGNDSGSSGENPVFGFGLTIGLLAVGAVVLSLVWKAASKKKQDSHR